MAGRLYVKPNEIIEFEFHELENAAAYYWVTYLDVCPWSTAEGQAPDDEAHQGETRTPAPVAKRGVRLAGPQELVHFLARVD